MSHSFLLMMPPLSPSYLSRWDQFCGTDQCGVEIDCVHVFPFRFPTLFPRDQVPQSQPGQYPPLPNKSRFACGRRSQPPCHPRCVPILHHRFACVLKVGRWYQYVNCLFCLMFFLIKLFFHLNIHLSHVQAASPWDDCQTPSHTEPTVLKKSFQSRKHGEWYCMVCYCIICFMNNLWFASINLLLYDLFDD